MQIGDTYLWSEGGHLWVVVSDPNLHKGEFIAVNLTKDAFRAGKECELNIGDHQWIKEKTYVSFGDAIWRLYPGGAQCRLYADSLLVLPVAVKYPPSLSCACSDNRRRVARMIRGSSADWAGS